MQRTISLMLLCCGSILLGACSGAKSGGGVVIGNPSSVTVTPGAASLALGAKQQFTANVMGSSDQTVLWEVNGAPGGNAAAGLISEGGVYLAPTALPPTGVTITAVSFANPSKTGTATVTLSQKSGVNVAIVGSSSIVLAQTFGPAVPFSATVTGTANLAVIWQVNGITGGASKTGTITAAGVYNPPHSVPVSIAPNTEGQTIDVIVTAISVADSTASDSADVVIFPPQQNTQSLPTKLGVSGGNANDSSSLGGRTFCCGGTLGAELVREGQNYILSNNHVLARADLGLAGSGNSGDAILQPGLIDNNCSTNGSSTVANLTQFYNLENGSGVPADAAIALVVSGDVDASGAILQLGGTNNGSEPTDGPPHSGSGKLPSVGETVAKSGRSTGLTCASVTATNIQTSVEYQRGCGMGTTFTVTYGDAFSVGDGTFSAEGDSGSLIVDMSTADARGLLFAGSDTDTVANPIGDVLTQMANPSTHALPTVFGSATTHPVAACSLPGPQSAISAGLALTRRIAPTAALQEAESARDAHSAELLARPAVLAVGAGISFDNPEETAVLLFVNKGQTPADLPREIDGVRTRIIESDASTKRGALSALESATAELAVESPLAVQSISEEETARALVVHHSHAAELLQQAGVQGVGITSSVDAPGEAALMIFLVRGTAHPAIPAVIEGLRTRIRASSRFVAGRRQLRAAQGTCAKPALLPPAPLTAIAPTSK